MIFEYEQFKVTESYGKFPLLAQHRTIEVTHRITRSILATSILKINEIEWRDARDDKENQSFSVLYLHGDPEGEIICGSRAENTEKWRKALMEK